MCGFFFLIKKNSDLSTKKLIVASNEVKHRGPDDDQIINNKDIFVRFFRLSIIDTRKIASQPMYDKTGRYLLVFNGEIYNFQKLRNKLTKSNLQSKSDTEVLLYSLIERGQNVINELEGMFSFIFYDTFKKTFFFGRDRFGIKPLYYSNINGNIIFSSEIKALLKLNKFQLNNNSFCNFFLKGSMDHDENTFFNNVFSIMPGHNGLVKNNKINIKKYWNLKKKKSELFSETSSYKKKRIVLENLLNTSLEKHLVSDRKIGLFLSGGTDSNAILNLILKRKNNENLNTFTYGFKNNFASSEISRVNKIISLNKKISNYNLLISPKDVLDNFDKTTKILESPFTSIRIIAMKKLYSLARKKGSVVILEGDGGDEIFGGYDYNLYSYLLDKYKKNRFKEKNIFNKLREFVQLSNKKDTHLINLLLTNSFQYSSTSDGTIFVNSDFINEEFLNNQIDESFYFEKKIDKFNNLQNAQLKDINEIKLPRSLKYKDRLSMSEGIETRVPLLDHKLFEFAFNLPNNCKFRGLKSRFIFKDVCQRKGFSKNMFEYSKKTIADPQKIWLKTYFKEFFIDTVSSQDFYNLNYFNPKLILKEFHKFCRDDKYPSSFAFFQILSFYRFYKVFKSKI